MADADWGSVLVALGELAHRLGVALEAARIPAALVLLAAIGWSLRRQGGRNSAGFGACVFGLGWIAQSYLLDERVWLAGLLYALAAAGYCLWQPRRSNVQLPNGVLIGCAISIVGIGVAACLYRLDVFPQLYYDEVAYLRAAEMQLGSIDRGAILSQEGAAAYSFEQFQSQTVPFALQSIAVAIGGDRIITLRWVSVAAAALTLGVAMAALWRQLGPRVSLSMGAMCAAAPLFLLYSRAGLYISISVLHGTLCVAAMLWLVDRWRPPQAVVLGALLGGALYFYQLSWFAPVLSAVVFALSPELRARAGAGRLTAIVVGVGVAVAAPGLIAFRAGINDVNAQTFDRAVWNRIDENRTRSSLLLPPPTITASELDDFRNRFRSETLQVRIVGTSRRDPGVLLEGDASVERAIAAARELNWRVLEDPWQLDSLASRIPAMLARFGFAASAESAGRWVAGPLLNPIVVPLLLFGLISVGRRWREWPLRLLWIWVVGGALLPAAIGGVMPRRSVLALPYLYAVAAVPLVALATSLPAAHLVNRVTSALGVLVLLALLTLTNAFVYFRTWDNRVADYAGAPQVLVFARLVEEIDGDGAVLIPRMFKSYQMELLRGSRVVEVPDTRNPAAIREASCRAQTPFFWITPDTPDETARFAALETDFLYRSDSLHGFRVMKLGTRRAGGCRDLRGAARP